MHYNLFNLLYFLWQWKVPLCTQQIRPNESQSPLLSHSFITISSQILFLNRSESVPCSISIWPLVLFTGLSLSTGLPPCFLCHLPPLCSPLPWQSNHSKILNYSYWSPYKIHPWLSNQNVLAILHGFYFAVHAYLSNLTSHHLIKPNSIAPLEIPPEQCCLMSSSTWKTQFQLTLPPGPSDLPFLPGSVKYVSFRLCIP